MAKSKLHEAARGGVAKATLHEAARGGVAKKRCCTESERRWRRGIGDAQGLNGSSLSSMTYTDWEVTVSEAVKRDTIWRVQAYRLALFLSACAAQDTRDSVSDPRCVHTNAQLCRAAGSIAANIAEGYPRRSLRDRVRYYEYALGSAAEAKVWYLSLEPHIGSGTLGSRFELLRSITRLLLTMIRSSGAGRPAAAGTSQT